MAKRPAKTRAPRRAHKHGRDLRTLEHVIAYLLELEVKVMALDQTVTDAIAAQDKKLADLAATVDAFIASHQGTSAADSAAVVAAFQSEGAAVDAIAAKLTPAP